MVKKRQLSKYRNKKVVIGGITFDSQKEYEYYEQLCIRQATGEISDLQRQVKFEIIPKGCKQETMQLKTKTKVVEKFVHHPITYTADFVYRENGQLVVCDCKASKKFKDPVYRLKSKLMFSILGIEIKELY